MNIIEAAKTLKPGTRIVSPSGIDYYLNEMDLLCNDEGEAQWFYLDDILSEKWTAVDD